jgi:6-pyruvoyltetrahydropterin/6-carboxytetrahydropterin synthase
VAPSPVRLAPVRLVRRASFSASHRIWRPDWDEARNRAVFGASASPLSHGHNYEVDVCISGRVDSETGMLVDLKWLKEILMREVEDRFDHRDLNDDTPYFKDAPPTAERVAEVIFGLLDAALPAGMLHSVRLRPVRDLEVEVRR